MMHAPDTHAPPPDGTQQSSVVQTSGHGTPGKTHCASYVGELILRIMAMEVQFDSDLAEIEYPHISQLP
jgi:hypothetical protein